MGLLHAAGLFGLRVPPAEGPWPYVLPGLLLPAHQEEALNLLQMALAPRPLPRVELSWTGRLPEATRAGLGWARARAGEGGVMVVVRLRQASQLPELMIEPALLGLRNLVVVSPAPGGGEPLGPLLATGRAVWRVLEELYDQMVSELRLSAPDLDALGEPLERWYSPSDLVGLVDAFVDGQRAGLEPGLAARQAVVGRVHLQIRSRPVAERRALLALVEGRHLDAEDPSLERLERQMLVGREPEEQRLLRWAAWLPEMPGSTMALLRDGEEEGSIVWRGVQESLGLGSHQPAVVRSVKFRSQETTLEDHHRALLAFLQHGWYASEQASRRDRLERLLKPLCADPVLRAPRVELSGTARITFLLGRAYLWVLERQPTQAATDLAEAAGLLGEERDDKVGKVQVDSWVNTFELLKPKLASEAALDVGARWLDLALDLNVRWPQVWRSLWTTSPGPDLASRGRRWLQWTLSSPPAAWVSVWKSLWSTSPGDPELRKLGMDTLGSHPGQSGGYEIWSELAVVVGVDSELASLGVRCLEAARSEFDVSVMLFRLQSAGVSPDFANPTLRAQVLRALKGRDAQLASFIPVEAFQSVNASLSPQESAELLAPLRAAPGAPEFLERAFLLWRLPGLRSDLRPMLESWLRTFPSHKDADRVRRLLTGSNTLSSP